MIRTRPATTADAPAVLDLWAEAGLVATVTDDVNAVERLIGRDGDALIVAVDDGNVVGAVIGGWDGWRGAIHRLAVAPSHRRRGLGTRLLEEAVSSLERRGAVRMACVVVADDLDGRRFWESTEFSAQDNRVRYVHPPG
jgi:ribosomal protein S18 acetylase RimI-like enzyme